MEATSGMARCGTQDWQRRGGVDCGRVVTPQLYNPFTRRAASATSSDVCNLPGAEESQQFLFSKSSGSFCGAAVCRLSLANAKCGCQSSIHPFYIPTSRPIMLPRKARHTSTPLFLSVSQSVSQVVCKCRTTVQCRSCHLHDAVALAGGRVHVRGRQLHTTTHQTRPRNSVQNTTLCCTQLSRQTAQMKHVAMNASARR